MEVTIGPGGTVTFKNSSSSVPHGVIWESGAPETPSCSGVPVGEGNWNTKWDGNCTLSKPGTYNFYCSYHGKAMSGSIVVSSTGTTTTETTMSGTTTTTSTTTSGNSPGTGSTPGSRPSPSSGSQPSSAPSATLAGNAVRIASSQRGTSVHGSVEIASSGSTLTVEVLAGSAELASAGHRARVGRVLRAGLLPGRASFAVHLDGRALRALGKRGHLKLVVRMTLAVPGTASAHRTLSVTLRRR
jgi:hypothetical protein